MSDAPGYKYVHGRHTRAVTRYYVDRASGICHHALPVKSYALTAHRRPQALMLHSHPPCQLTSSPPALPSASPSPKCRTDPAQSSSRIPASAIHRTSTANCTVQVVARPTQDYQSISIAFQTIANERAYFCPMHILGPSPNGFTASSWSSAKRASIPSQRSGWNSEGSAKYEGEW